MVDSINEKRLLTELKNGSFHAFERLYNMYSGKLYNFIMRISSGNQYMADEVVQSAFIRVWEVRQTVEYVYNEYLKNTGVDRDSQTEESIDLRFLNEYIDSLAEELPAQRKKIFILSKRQNYTNKEIAEMMGISESTVATQLSLAVKFMREQLMKHYDKIVALLFAFFVNEM